MQTLLSNGMEKQQKKTLLNNNRFHDKNGIFLLIKHLLNMFDERKEE